MKPKAFDCAAMAMELLDGPEIPYVLGGETIKGLDCQGLIEYVVRKLGGRMSYRGSNHMYREACDKVLPLADAKRLLVPGCVLFIVDEGDTPSGYYDNKGNASHVGWYTGGKHEVVHASSSRGKVAASTLKNAWTHAGWLKEVEYMSENENAGGGGAPVMATVKTGNGGPLNMRMAPSILSALVTRIPNGATVEIVEQEGEWTRVAWEGRAGYVMSSFLETGSPVTATARELAMQVYELIKSHLGE